MLTIVAGAAHATMLTATGGSIGVDPYVYEPGGTISGTDWALFGWSGSSCCVFGGTPVFMSLHVAALTVGTTTYAAACCDNNSFFTVTQPELGNCEISDCPPFTAPFTIAGHVNLADGFDVRGSGMLFSGGGYPVIGRDFVRYEFQPTAARLTATVPEPATLPMMITGLVACYLLAFVPAVLRGRMTRPWAVK